MGNYLELILLLAILARNPMKKKEMGQHMAKEMKVTRKVEKGQADGEIKAYILENTNDWRNENRGT